MTFLFILVAFLGAPAVLWSMKIERSKPFPTQNRLEILHKLQQERKLLLQASTNPSNFEALKKNKEELVKTTATSILEQSKALTDATSSDGGFNTYTLAMTHLNASSLTPKALQHKETITTQLSILVDKADDQHTAPNFADLMAKIQGKLDKSRTSANSNQRKIVLEETLDSIQYNITMIIPGHKTFADDHFEKLGTAFSKAY